MPSGSKSKQDAARKARLEREAAERAAADRKKRLGILGAAVLAIVVVVGIVLAAGVFKDDPADKGTKTNVPGGGTVTGVKETTDLLKGIPVKGNRLGQPNAPATIIEFADLKCPICKEHELTNQPTIIKDLVRTGKANLEVRLVNVIDPNMGTVDGERARTVANNLLTTDKYWAFVHTTYYNQGAEQESWATDKKLKEIALAVGVPEGQISSRLTATNRDAQAADQKLFEDLGATGTPSLFVQARGTREYRPVQNFTSIDDITKAVDEAAKKAK
ncbi:DsbA family protein [Patulibacter defluvii]|uniref:DsbA family protein n=1 Tax=Patulibacter defluvii TaxID=3095358 RepID=UPI002A7662C5|nr:DsbA family protein [Patulibacter sp. DM4]